MVDETIKEKKKVDNRKKGRLLMWIFLITGIFFILITFTLKIFIENFSWTATSVIIILCLGLFGGGSLAAFFYSRRKVPAMKGNGEKLPKPITFAEARKLARLATKDDTYSENLGECEGESIKNVGKGSKSQIYTYLGEGLQTGRKYAIVINMHYPRDLKTILTNPTEKDINEAVKLLASYPEDTPSILETFSENPLLGSRQYTKSTNPFKPINKKKEVDLD